MMKKRLIPCLLLQNGQLVKSIGFREYQIIGNPKIAVKFFNAWSVDEIIFLDISRDADYTSLIRYDYNFKRLETLTDIVRECAKICFVPLTVGGGIRTIEQMLELFRSGADKVVINTEAFRNPSFITDAAQRFGSQAVVVSIDVRGIKEGEHKVYIDHGSEATGTDPIAWAREASRRGAGEIFLTSIDRDGLLEGYDLKLLKRVTAAMSVPVIACGGVGEWQDLVDGVTIGGADAVAAANIFHFTEQSTRHAKEYMLRAGLDVRKG